MTELKIVMNDYGVLYAVLPSGEVREIVADVYRNPYYGIVRIGKEQEEEHDAAD